MSVFNLTANKSKLAHFMQWVVNKLPPRLKRIVYIGLIFGYFNKKDEVNMELLKKINDTFRTADHPRAYELPIAVKSILWRDFNLDGVVISTTEIDGKHLLTSQCKMDICKHIVDNIPEWIRYSSQARIYRDTMFIINELEDSTKGLAIPA